MKRLACALVLLCAPPLSDTALAQSHSYGYLGAAGGKAFEDEWGFSTYGGYVFNRWVGVQVAYLEFPNVTNADLYFPIGTLETKAVGASLVFTPIHAHKVDGRFYAGVADVKSTLTRQSPLFTTIPPLGSNEKRSTQPLIGVSFDYAFTPHVEMRVAFDAVRASHEADEQYIAYMHSIGIAIRF